MSTVIAYAAGEARRRFEPGAGHLAAGVAPLAAAAIVYLSHTARMHMAVARGEWCGTPVVRALQQLHGTGLLLLVPAGALLVAWRAGVGVVICRMSLIVSVVMWLVYLISAARLDV
jgi:hypothetical protein